MRVLVTNDDGVTSPGLLALARGLVEAGHDVVVAAPLDDRSGSGAAIGPMDSSDGVEVVEHRLAGLDAVPAYGLDGPPGLAVITARLGAFGDPPDVVAAGVNPGNNTGRSVLHSGTVGAALTAANFGISALAVSIGVGEHMHYETSEPVAAAAMGWLAGAPAKTVLNVNLPNLAFHELRGVRWARLAPFGTVRSALGERSEQGRIQFELRATEAELDPDTDTVLVAEGFVTVTALVGVRADEPVDAADAIEARLSLPGARAGESPAGLAFGSLTGT